MTFTRDDEAYPYAHPGYNGMPGQLISLPYPHYPSLDDKDRYFTHQSCVLHEMMHAIGILHEHTRKDGKMHQVELD